MSRRATVAINKVGFGFRLMKKRSADRATYGAKRAKRNNPYTNSMSVTIPGVYIVEFEGDQVTPSDLYAEIRAINCEVDHRLWNYVLTLQWNFLSTEECDGSGCSVKFNCCPSPGQEHC